jgi:hypothetical protein
MNNLNDSVEWSNQILPISQTRLDIKQIDNKLDFESILRKVRLLYLSSLKKEG